jgi:hypothetical protein
MTTFIVESDDQATVRESELELTEQNAFFVTKI